LIAYCLIFNTLDKFNIQIQIKYFYYMGKPYLAVFLGNILTKYDQALFSLLAPIWAPVLFSQHDSVTALILTYSLFLLDWIVRPFGAYFFGWLGDQWGPQRSLFYSLTGIVIATWLMSSFSLFSSDGILSPIFLLGIRWLQNFCAAGEAANGAVLLLENTPESQRTWISSLYDMSSTVGLLCAAILVALLGRWGILETQWSWLFRIASVLALYGLFLRLKMVVVYPSKQLTVTPTMPLLALLKHYWLPLIAIISVSGFSYTTYTVAFTLMQGYMPLVSSISYQKLLEINVGLISLDVLLLPIWGYVAKRWGYRRQMLSAAIGMLFSLFPIFWLMQKATFNTLLICRIWIVVFGVAFSATYHAWVHALMDKKTRYRIASLGYTLGSRLVGMPASVVSLWIFQKTGLIGAPVFYLGITAIAATFAVFKTKPLSN
jgi:MHS family proline/betaine transporter-like MFS transporter